MRASRAQRLDWADRARKAREGSGLGMRSAAAREAGIRFADLQAIENGYQAPPAERERLGRSLIGDPQSLLTADEAKASARASGRSFEKWRGDVAEVETMLAEAPESAPDDEPGDPWADDLLLD